MSASLPLAPTLMGESEWDDMYAEHKHRGFFARIVEGMLDKRDERLLIRLQKVAARKGMADMWNLTRACHHCGLTTLKMGACCCWCGGDKDTPHMARAVGGRRPCCRICQSAPLPPLPLSQQAISLQQSRKVGEIETYTGVQKAAKVMHRMPASIWNESNVPKVSGKLPVVGGNVERDTPQPGIPRVWKYDDDTQPRLPRVERVDEEGDGFDG